MHPTLTRAIIAAGRIGSTARTPRGILRAFGVQAKDPRFFHFAARPTVAGAKRSYPADHDTRYNLRLTAIVNGQEKCPTKAKQLRAESSRIIRENSLSAQLTEQWPYWRSRSYWVGGSHHTTVKLVDSPHGVGASISTEKVWDSGGKCRSGTNSFAGVRIDKNTPDRLILLGGIITVSARKVRGHKQAWVAKWIEQKADSANSPLRVVSGWIVRDYHSTAATVDLAIAEERQARKTRHTAGLRRAIQKSTEIASLSRKYLTWQDSLAAGNCEAGTRNAAAAVASAIGLSVEELVKGVAVRADIVMGAIPESSRSFAGRMIMYAH